MPAKIKFTEEQESEIVSQYINGKSMGKISQVFLCDAKVIAKVIKKNNINILHRPYKFNTKILEQICNEYKNGAKISDLRKKYNSDYTSIRSALSRGNVKVATGYERTYDVNDNYFETIDTEEKAYWLGFIVTDGCVTNNHTKDKNDTTVLTIHLQGIDIGHLEKFKKAVAFTGPIKINKSNNNSVLINISSAKMCKDLMKYGIIRRKTGKCYKSDLIPEHLEKHFWRGCIDGDGTLSTLGYFGFVVGFVGGEKLVLDFINFCKNNKLNYTKFSQDKRSKIPTFGVYYWYNNSQKLMELLYKDAKIYLNRKFERYELFTHKLDWLL